MVAGEKNEDFFGEKEKEKREKGFKKGIFLGNKARSQLYSPGEKISSKLGGAQYIPLM